jgi:hypothetical protein
MRTTLTLDDDVAAKLKDICRRTGESFRAALNRILRDGLNTRKVQTPDKPFRVKARALGLRQGVRLDNIGELLEQLDGPGHA